MLKFKYKYGNSPNSANVYINNIEMQQIELYLKGLLKFLLLLRLEITYSQRKNYINHI